MVEKTDDDKLVDKISRRFKKLKADKQVWNTMYQSIGEYIRLRKQDFTSEDVKGKFLTSGIYDSTAIFANRAMAAALLGALFPNGAKTVDVTPPPDMENTKAVQEYYIWITRKLAEYMEIREAGLSLVLDEYMLDAGAFGWGGVTLHDDKEDFEVPIKFSNWDAAHTYIDENIFGFVNTVYYEKKMEVFDAAKEYGQDKLSDKAKEAILAGKVDVTERILVAIQPRDYVEPGKMGNKNKPIASYHINLETKTLLRESGFDYMPPTMARFSKNSGEVYGRGAGTDSFPDVTMANALAEAIIRAGEKQLDPPLAILDDGTLGSDMIDSSAGAVNVLSYQGRLPTSNPLFPLFTVGEFRDMRETLKETREKISQHFLIDRLLDFNNDVRMTLGEVQIRERIRGQSLSAVFNRQISEMFDPLIKKSFNVLFSRGFLGVVSEESEQAKTLKAKGVEVKLIPQEVVDRMNAGAEVYNLKYISPAMRVMQKEEVTSALTLMDTAIQAYQVQPNIADTIDWDKMMKLVNDKTGGNTDLIRPDEDVKKDRDARAKAQQEQFELEKLKTGALAARDGAQAKQMLEAK